jgi:hypothetical protein
MREQQINRIASKIIVVLSFLALIAVHSGYAQPPQPDEGTAAHLVFLRVKGDMGMVEVTVDGGIR